MGVVIVRTFTPLRVGKSNLAVLILANRSIGEAVWRIPRLFFR